MIAICKEFLLWILNLPFLLWLICSQDLFLPKQKEIEYSNITHQTLHIKHYTSNTTHQTLHIKHYTPNTTQTLHTKHYTNTTHQTLHTKHYTNTTHQTLHKHYTNTTQTLHTNHYTPITTQTLHTNHSKPITTKLGKILILNSSILFWFVWIFSHLYIFLKIVMF